MMNYDRTAGLIFRSSIPPPSEDTPDESLTIVAQRKSLDDNKETVDSTNQLIKPEKLSKENESIEITEQTDMNVEENVEQEKVEHQEEVPRESSEDVKLEESMVVE